MERVVRDFVLGDVVEAIFESPVGQRIALGKSSSDRSILEEIDPGAFKSLPSGAAVDHAVSAQGLKSTLEGFDLADTVIFLNVFLPQISSVSLVVRCLVSDRDSFGTEDLGLESVVFFNFLKEFHGLREQVEGIDAHDSAFVAILQVSHAVKQVGNDDITGNHSIRENSVSVVLAGNFEGVHGLFFQVLQTHFLRFGDELFLVELLGGDRDKTLSHDGGSVCRGESGSEVSAVDSDGGEKGELHCWIDFELKLK
mmetsp:Transcript_9370/g.23336  ORF Transcript_9370/g.23336 Transcript_9370/m.23336 type:complete len:254 (-) Transcript_9370:86-847(-)